MAGLQFSDTSTRQGLIQDCEDNLNFPAAGISGTSALLQQFTRQINIWYHKIITMIFASQDDWDWDDSNQTDYPIATTDLVANQQDYTIPVSLNVLKIQRIDVSYDGGTTWKRAVPIDAGSINVALSSTNIAQAFSTDNPKYDIRNNAIFLYPVPSSNSTGGLKIWFSRGPLEFATTDTTKLPGFDAAFHRMLSLGASYDYAFIKNLPTQAALLNLLQDYEARLKQYYGRKNEDVQWSLKSSYDDRYYT